MNQQVHVRSFEAVEQYRAALVGFIHTARGVLQQADQLVLRLVQWASQERPAFWQAELRRSWDLVAQARQALAQCEQQFYGEDRATCYQQRKALEAAKRYTHHADEKVHLCRRWSAQAQRAWTQYRGSTQPLRTLLESELEKHLAFLDRVLESLQQYVHTAAPAPQGAETAAGGNPATAAATAPGTTAAEKAWDAETLGQLQQWIPLGPQRKQLFAEQGVLPPLVLGGAEAEPVATPAEQQEPPPWLEAAEEFAQQLEVEPQPPSEAQHLVVCHCPLPEQLRDAVQYVAVRRQGQLPQDSGWTVLVPAPQAKAPEVQELRAWFAEHPEAACWLGLPPGHSCLVGKRGLLEVWDCRPQRLWPPQPAPAS